MVTFRDIPEAMTHGDDEADALLMAKDGLIVSMDFYVDDKRPVPLPSTAQPGERLIALPASVSAKILLLNEMLAQKIIAADLARRLGTSPQVINRLIDLRHNTGIDKIEAAFEAMGKHLAMRLD